MSTDKLRCPACEALLGQVERVPDPELGDGRLTWDIGCPDCELSLTAVLEIVMGGDAGFEVRKYVKRA
jgi:hypothetical protein